MKKLIISGIIVALSITIATYVVSKQYNKPIYYQGKSEDATFSTNFIKESHKTIDNKNYMISPYSVEMALSMLRDGTKGETHSEISKVAPKRTIKTLSVKDKVNVANALFVKNKFKKDVRKDYSYNLKENYNAEFIYDDFKTPDVINNWVNKETNGMIKKILDRMDDQFVLGLANAIAMEEEWQMPFTCENTKKADFTTKSGEKYKVAMMNNTFEDTASYYADDDAEAIILPYKQYDYKTGKVVEEDGERLEFIGIIPKDIDKYINNLSLDTIKKIDQEKETASSDIDIYLELPRFSYSYDFKDFKKTLNNMGIETVFTPSADLSGMLDNHDEAYVNEAIHKTYVKVDEVGTKAAAVTYFGVKDTAMPIDEKKHVSIVFDKPFIFMIKDTKTNEIAFFGVVYKPNKYENKSCE